MHIFNGPGKQSIILRKIFTQIANELKFRLYMFHSARKETIQMYKRRRTPTSALQLEKEVTTMPKIDR